MSLRLLLDYVLEVDLFDNLNLKVSCSADLVASDVPHVLTRPSTSSLPVSLLLQQHRLVATEQ